MINDVSLLYAITNKIRAEEKWNTKEKCGILIDDNEEQIKVPTFSVRLNLMGTDNIIANQRMKTMSATITYIKPNSKSLTLDNLNIMDDLTELFDEYLELKTRKIPILSKDYLNNNSIFKMTFKFVDSKATRNEKPDYTYDDLMKVVNFTVNVNDKIIKKFTVTDKNIKQN